MNVYHGHLIYYDYVGFYRVLLILLKTILVPDLDSPIQFQQPVDGHSFITCSLRHALCRPACGCRQDDIQIIHLKTADHEINGGGFSCAGAAGYHHNPLRHGSFHRQLLQVIHFQVILFFQLFQLPIQLFTGNRKTNIKIQKHPGSILLHEKIGG